MKVWNWDIGVSPDCKDIEDTMDAHLQECELIIPSMPVRLGLAGLDAKALCLGPEASAGLPWLASRILSWAQNINQPRRLVYCPLDSGFQAMRDWESAPDRDSAQTAVVLNRVDCLGHQYIKEVFDLAMDKFSPELVLGFFRTAHGAETPEAEELPGISIIRPCRIPKDSGIEVMRSECGRSQFVLSKGGPQQLRRNGTLTNLFANSAIASGLTPEFLYKLGSFLESSSYTYPLYSQEWEAVLNKNLAAVDFDKLIRCEILVQVGTDMWRIYHHDLVTEPVVRAVYDRSQPVNSGMRIPGEQEGASFVAASESAQAPQPLEPGPPPQTPIDLSGAFSAACVAIFEGLHARPPKFADPIRKCGYSLALLEMELLSDDETGPVISDLLASLSGLGPRLMADALRLIMNRPYDDNQEMEELFVLLVKQLDGPAVSQLIQDALMLGETAAGQMGSCLAESLAENDLATAIKTALDVDCDADVLWRFVCGLTASNPEAIHQYEWLQHLPRLVRNLRHEPDTLDKLVKKTLAKTVEDRDPWNSLAAAIVITCALNNTDDYSDTVNRYVSDCPNGIIVESIRYAIDRASFFALSQPAQINASKLWPDILVSMLDNIPPQKGDELHSANQDEIYAFSLACATACLDQNMYGNSDFSDLLYDLCEQLPETTLSQCLGAALEISDYDSDDEVPSSDTFKQFASILGIRKTRIELAKDNDWDDASVLQRDDLAEDLVPDLLKIAKRLRRSGQMQRAAEFFELADLAAQRPSHDTFWVAAKVQKSIVETKLICLEQDILEANFTSAISRFNSMADIVGRLNATWPKRWDYCKRAVLAAQGNLEARTQLGEAAQRFIEEKGPLFQVRAQNLSHLWLFGLAVESRNLHPYPADLAPLVTLEEEQSYAGRISRLLASLLVSPVNSAMPEYAGYSFHDEDENQYEREFDFNQEEDQDESDEGIWPPHSILSVINSNENNREIAQKPFVEVESAFAWIEQIIGFEGLSRESLVALALCAIGGDDSALAYRVCNLLDEFYDKQLFNDDMAMIFARVSILAEQHWRALDCIRGREDPRLRTFLNLIKMQWSSEGSVESRSGREFAKMFLARKDEESAIDGSIQEEEPLETGSKLSSAMEAVFMEADADKICQAAFALAGFYEDHREYDIASSWQWLQYACLSMRLAKPDMMASLCFKVISLLLDQIDSENSDQVIRSAIETAFYVREGAPEALFMGAVDCAGQCWEARSLDLCSLLLSKAHEISLNTPDKEGFLAQTGVALGELHRLSAEMHETPGKLHDAIQAWEDASRVLDSTFEKGRILIHPQTGVPIQPQQLQSELTLRIAYARRKLKQA